MISIADAVDAKSGDMVTVSGTIATVIEGNEYMLTDGTTTDQDRGGPGLVPRLSAR